MFSLNMLKFFLLSLNLVFGGKEACVIASKWG